MKSLFFILSLFTFCSNNKVSTNEQVLVYKDLTIKTGTCENGSYIKLTSKDKLLYEKCGGEGSYGKIDTSDFNNDRLTDFLVVYESDDYFEIFMLISKKTDNYSMLKIGEYFYADVYCNDIGIDNNKNLNCFLITKSKDKYYEILVNFIVNADKITPTCNSDTIAVKNILKNL